MATIKKTFDKAHNLGAPSAPWANQITQGAEDLHTRLEILERNYENLVKQTQTTAKTTGDQLRRIAQSSGIIENGLYGDFTAMSGEQLALGLSMSLQPPEWAKGVSLSANGILLGGEPLPFGKFSSGRLVLTAYAFDSTTGMDWFNVTLSEATFNSNLVVTSVNTNPAVAPLIGHTTGIGIVEELYVTNASAPGVIISRDYFNINWLTDDVTFM